MQARFLQYAWLLIPLALYLPFVTNEYVTFDDLSLVRDNPQVHTFDPSIWWSYDPELYVPLTLLSYQIDHVLLGGSATVVHTTNLALHLLVTFLVFLLLQKLSFSYLHAVFGALVFSLHPLQVESVAWASGRKEILFAGFFLLAILLYLQSDSKKSLLSYLAALLSKVTAVTLPVVLVLSDYVRIGKLEWRDVTNKWPYWVLSSIFGIVAVFGKSSDVVLNSWETVLLSFRTAAFGLQKFFVPTDLTILHPITETIRIGKPEYFLPILFLVGIFGVLFALRRRQRLAVFGFLFFFVTLSPSLLGYAKAGQIQLLSEHYLYLPVIGLIVTLMSILHKRTVYIVVPWLFILLFVSYQRLGDWRNSEALYLRVLEVYPASHVAANNLAGAYLLEDNVEAAEVFVVQALEYKPNYAKAYANLSEVYRRQQKFIDAQRATLKALELDPDVFAKVDFGVIQVEDADATIVALQQQLEIDPNNAEIWWQLGNAYGQKEMYIEGIQAFQKAAALDPSRAQQAEELQRILESLEK